MASAGNSMVPVPRSGRAPPTPRGLPPDRRRRGRAPARRLKDRAGARAKSCGTSEHQPSHPPSYGYHNMLSTTYKSRVQTQVGGYARMH